MVTVTEYKPFAYSNTFWAFPSVSQWPTSSVLNFVIPSQSSCRWHPPGSCPRPVRRRCERKPVNINVEQHYSMNYWNFLKISKYHLVLMDGKILWIFRTKHTFFERQSSPISLTGCTTPISLLTIMTIKYVTYEDEYTFLPCSYSIMQYS